MVFGHPIGLYRRIRAGTPLPGAAPTSSRGFHGPDGSLYWEGRIGRFGWLIDVDNVHHEPTAQLMTTYWLVWGVLFGPFGLCWFRASSLRVAQLSRRTQVPPNPVMERIFAELLREARRTDRSDQASGEPSTHRSFAFRG